MTLRSLAVMAGGIGAAAVVAGTVGHSPQFFRSYLFAYVFWLGLPLGACGFAMIHPLVGGSWGVAIRPALLASVRTLPLVALLFVPVAAGLSGLYVNDADSSTARLVYMRPAFFLARALVYFAVWSLLSWTLVRWSRAAGDGSAPAPRRLKVLCAGGLVAYFLTVSLAGVDWVMALEPTYYSTVYGFIFIAEQALAALAFAVAASAWLRRRGFAVPRLPKDERLTWRDLGSLLATSVLLWAYLQYSQLIINWAGDTQQEIPWYLHRSAGGWGRLAGLLILLNFAVPFFVLLFRRVKDELKALAWVALALVAVHVLDIYWLVVPSYGEPLHVHWLDVAAWVAVGAVWTAGFVVALPGRALSA